MRFNDWLASGFIIWAGLFMILSGIIDDDFSLIIYFAVGVGIYFKLCAIRDRQK